ncbi:MAG TPA: ribosome silencing factor [Roseiarcus sp.]|jgi:ribosome-associated protein|nr:ribosome silencing factor [Roseiarcus sp.]
MFRQRGRESPLRKRNATLNLTPHSAAPAAGSPAASGSARTADVLSQIIVEGLEDAKAEDIVSIDLSGRTTLADRMIIASGRSSVHVGAIADRVVKACRDAGYPSPKVEGMPLCDWVLLDAQNAIVHVFRPDVRRFYNLEKMWSADRPGEAAKS